MTLQIRLICKKNPDYVLDPVKLMCNSCLEFLVLNNRFVRNRTICLVEHLLTHEQIPCRAFTNTRLEHGEDLNKFRVLTVLVAVYLVPIFINIANNGLSLSYGHTKGKVCDVCIFWEF